MRANIEEVDNLKQILTFLTDQLKGLEDNTTASFQIYFSMFHKLMKAKVFELCFELVEANEILCNLLNKVIQTVNATTTFKCMSLYFKLMIPLLNDCQQISKRSVKLLVNSIMEPHKSKNPDACFLVKRLITEGNDQFKKAFISRLNKNFPKHDNDIWCLLYIDLASESSLNDLTSQLSMHTSSEKNSTSAMNQLNTITGMMSFFLE